MEPFDIADEHGNISILKRLTHPRYSKSDPRYLSPETSDRLAQIAIRRMQAAADEGSRIDQLRL